MIYALFKYKEIWQIFLKFGRIFLAIENLNNHMILVLFKYIEIWRFFLKFSSNFGY